MIAIVGSFRMLPDAAMQARPLLLELIEATRAEPGCRQYAYAEDVIEPGLFRITELWDSREALAAHLDMPHLSHWIAARAALGFTDRQITLYDIGEGEAI